MERIITLNDRLRTLYGIDSNTARPIFRIVWANDQFEKRLMGTLDSGIQLLYPIVREVKKYPYLNGLWVLERLVIVPDTQLEELPTQKLSYEPIWAFRDDRGQPLPPKWEAVKLIVDTLYAALGKKSLAKYVEDAKNTSEEGRQERIANLQQELFGNETEVTDALRYKEGIVVP